LGGRIPTTMLLLLIAAHSVVILFIGWGKSSAGMEKDQHPWSLGFLLLYCPSTSPLISPSSPYDLLLAAEWKGEWRAGTARSLVRRRWGCSIYLARGFSDFLL
jgi:hypothetical protein